MITPARESAFVVLLCLNLPQRLHAENIIIQKEHVPRHASRVVLRVGNERRTAKRAIVVVRSRKMVLPSGVAAMRKAAIWYPT